MRILWVLAHPDPASLNARLRDAAVPRLHELGHELVESDLYRMGFDPVLTTADLLGEPPLPGTPVSHWQRTGHEQGRLAADIRAEQAKLLRSDLIVLQFPLWWYGLPAILKGWIDRTLVAGFAFGVVDPDTGKVRKYGDGGLAGRRGLAVVSAGDRPGALGPRGISGHIDDVLWPLLHGTFHYTGTAPLPAHLLSSVHHRTGAWFEHEVDRLVQRIDGAGTETPIPYRTLAGGDYGPDHALRPEIAPGSTGNEAHLAPAAG
ncbi:NAD(P)H-dependent oxidoreductase [Myceligenerans indicum]|uniref:NAD(P)H-dependent oxidoreductase n=1 Tax=Myceligenerans indicum TaxID=2593663 RepID=A0ABS1LPR6_9MICO|nr:NAD(P)H-dependent oxidoreductase [Myceligenerans indicum]MBL0888237.1 NAD(P)H-dependent oxidoreductase [Myceligenerans indicum]